MNLLFWGLTLGTLGKVLVAVGILRVHYVMAMEKSIDEIVIRSFRLEKILTIVGILLILIGYFAELHFYNLANLLDCRMAECNHSIDIDISQ